MNLIGNIIWILFGGLALFLEYVLSGLALCLTIVGIPFGIQCFKIALLMLVPFGKEVRDAPGQAGGCLSPVFNIIWIVFAGFWIALTHLFFGILLAITLIGIPFAKQHFKLMKLSFAPFGKEVY